MKRTITEINMFTLLSIIWIETECETSLKPDRMARIAHDRPGGSLAS